MKRNNIHRFFPVLTVIIILGIFTGCEKAQTGKPFSCRVGTKYVIEHNIMFSIDSISDYRCPEDVICIWGGDVELFFSINVNLVRTDTVIKLYGNNPVDIGGYTWKVLEVSPLPNTTRVTEQKDYRVELLITED
jgi:hypothetical protein